uniref:Uncharacterized protein n=1 Tax=Candidatus Kentrum sp. LFY TaxID=2126342 RepID=A0A450UFH6_9GAMM|nr:MAG: hypothetical protein BECKLFY1418B_GA0070995_100833 [Candidatus Kentron sp. LFY]VFJ91306.1 MAG: hypothetical protein BECKLFY1418A_GA0070994_101516 [Candidatus Kentron sp. LFY]
MSKLSTKEKIASIINHWSQLLIVLGVSLTVGMMVFFTYEDVDPYIELLFFIFMIVLFSVALLKQHKDYLHMQRDREKLLERMRDMADDRRPS